MLADAFAAERLRFFKARGVLFWSLGFVPLVSIGIGLIQGLLMRGLLARAVAEGNPAAALARQPVSLLNQAVESVSGSNFFLVQLFFLLAGSAILAGDYRWETWRFLTPRNTRANLLLAKLATFGLATLIGLVLLAFGGGIAGLISAGLTGGGVQWARAGEYTNAQFAGIFAIAFLEMLALGALAAVIAVVTRTGIAALLAPVGVWIVQGFVVSQVSKGFPDPLNPPLQCIAGFPVMDTDLLKAALSPAQVGETVSVNWPAALLALLLWIAGLTALAVWLFRRQDLTRE
ncbi:MAG: ABC transporter permease subunit [Caulobacterales bacterium]|nr:ABC transporter permease subunit [Caulobacterales bacterium]